MLRAMSLIRTGDRLTGAAAPGLSSIAENPFGGGGHDPSIIRGSQDLELLSACDQLLDGIAAAENEVPHVFAFHLGFEFDEGIAQPASGCPAMLTHVAGLQKPGVGEGQGPLANQHVDGFESWVPRGSSCAIGTPLRRLIVQDSSAYASERRAVLAETVRVECHNVRRAAGRYPPGIAGCRAGIRTPGDPQTPLRRVVHPPPAERVANRGTLRMGGVDTRA